MDGRVGGENAVGQAHDGVQVELAQQLGFDARRHPVAEQKAVRHHDAAASARLERAHHELHEQQRRLAGPRGLREVQLDAGFLLAPKGRVGDDHFEAVLLPDLLERRFQGVIAADVRILDAVQQQVHRPQQVGQRLLLDPEQALVLQRALVFGALHLRP